jgi:VWFA-related protein
MRDLEPVGLKNGLTQRGIKSVGMSTSAGLCRQRIGKAMPIRNGGLKVRFVQRVTIAVLMQSLVMAFVAAQTAPSRDGNQEVFFTACVTDKSGAPITGLTGQDFTVLLDNKPVRIDYFSAKDAPASIVILLDTSTTMGQYVSWQEVASLLTRLMAISNPASKFLLITFNASPEIAADWTSDTGRITSAVDAAENGPRKKATALYDSCILGLDKVTKTTTERRYMLLISDGMDTSSKAGAEDCHRLVQDSVTPISCIGFSDPMNNPLAGNGRTEMNKLASLSGGGFFFPRSKQQLATSIEQIAQWIRREYRIGVLVPKDGKYHRLSVKAHSPQNPKMDHTVGFPDKLRAAN